MSRAWRLLFSKEALHNLKEMDASISDRLTSYLKERVMALDDPRKLGKALTGVKLGNYWRYRTGSCRIIVNIIDSDLIVLVVRVGDRKDVY